MFLKQPEHRVGGEGATGACPGLVLVENRSHIIWSLTGQDPEWKLHPLKPGARRGEENNGSHEVITLVLCGIKVRHAELKTQACLITCCVTLGMSPYLSGLISNISQLPPRFSVKLADDILDWPNSSFGFFHTMVEKSEWTFCPMQYFESSMPPEICSWMYSKIIINHTEASLM